MYYSGFFLTVLQQDQTVSSADCKRTGPFSSLRFLQGSKQVGRHQAQTGTCLQ